MSNQYQYRLKFELTLETTGGRRQLISQTPKPEVNE